MSALLVNLIVSYLDHRIINGYGILSHYADRAKNFESLSVSFKDEIKVCAGNVNVYSSMSGNHDEYFKKYNVLLEIKNRIFPMSIKMKNVKY